jgi:hypothetical protein
MIKKINNLLLVGWREWCQLPQLNIRGIKAKIDTGARTSALHAFNIRLHNKKGRQLVQFSVYPLQGDRSIIVNCEAPLVDTRYITSSNGHKEYRYIILTNLTIGSRTRVIELSLSNRDPLKFRMLLGREALKNIALIDANRSFCQGRIKKSAIKSLYGGAAGA